MPGCRGDLAVPARGAGPRPPRACRAVAGTRGPAPRPTRNGCDGRGRSSSVRATVRARDAVDLVDVDAAQGAALVHDPVAALAAPAVQGQHLDLPRREPVELAQRRRRCGGMPTHRRTRRRPRTRWRHVGGAPATTSTPDAGRENTFELDPTGDRGRRGAEVSGASATRSHRGGARHGPTTCGHASFVIVCSWQRKLRRGSTQKTMSCHQGAARPFRSWRLSQRARALTDARTAIR